MRCAVTFEKIIQRRGDHLHIWNGVTNYPDYTFAESSERLAASVITLPAGTYTLGADAEGVTCKVYTYIDEQAAGVFPASGEGELPYTFTLPETRKISVNFAYAGWGDTEITTDAVQNAIICKGSSVITADVWETVTLHPHELADSDTITQAVNSKMSVTLRILPSFEAWQFCEKSVTYVRITDLDRDSDRIIFRGRVSEITDSMDDSEVLYQDVICVSALDFLEDTSFFDDECADYLVNPTDPTKGLIPYSMIGRHNSAVGDDTFRRFSYQITGNARYAKGGTVYGSRYSVLSAMLTDGNLRKYLGGGGAYTMEFRESFAGDSNTIQIAEKFGRVADTAILIGDNLRSIRVEKALQDAVYTRIRAVSGVNSDGSREFAYATNDEMYAKYGGGRELLVVSDNIKCTAPMYEETQYSTYSMTEAYRAMRAALEEFAKQEAANLSDPPVKLTISADDLAEMGFKGYEPFEVGNSYPVICPPLGLNGKPMRITALKRRLYDGRIEQITIEAGKKVVRSSSSLSAMMSRLEELNQQISDNAAEQVEIAQTVAEEIVEEQTDGVKIKLSHPQGYGEVQHLNLVTDENGRTDLYADEYLIGGSGGYSILGLTKAQYDALETYSNKTIYVVDNSGTTEMYVGDQLITQKGGGGATIETATVLSSEQMTEWAPEHALVPVEFRGNAHVYYAQPPAKIVIQGQRGLFGSQTITTSDLAAEIAFDFTQNEQTVRQKLKAFVASFSYSNNDLVVQLGVACYDITGAAEVLVGFGTVSQSAALALPLSSVSIGLLLVVESLTAQDSEELVPQCRVRVGYISGQNQGFWNAPSITGSLFNGTFAVDFGSDAERGFASGIARRTEPSYDNDESEEAAENDNS